jgi:hypothetical protein
MVYLNLWCNYRASRVITRSPVNQASAYGQTVRFTDTAFQEQLRVANSYFINGIGRLAIAVFTGGKSTAAACFTLA